MNALDCAAATWCAVFGIVVLIGSKIAQYRKRKDGL